MSLGFTGYQNESRTFSANTCWSLSTRGKYHNEYDILSPRNFLSSLADTEEQGCNLRSWPGKRVGRGREFPGQPSIEPAGPLAREAAGFARDKWLLSSHLSRRSRMCGERFFPSINESHLSKSEADWPAGTGSPEWWLGPDTAESVLWNGSFCGIVRLRLRRWMCRRNAQLEWPVTKRLLTYPKRVYG